MSCRQSVPARDRVTAVGDRGSASQLRSEIIRCTSLIQDDTERNSRVSALITWMRQHKISFEMRVIGNRIVPMIDLVPTVSPRIPRSVCAVSLDGMEPKLDLDPLLRDLLNKGSSLTVYLDSALPSPRTDINGQGFSTVEEDIQNAQRCALDIAVVRKLQDEPVPSVPGTSRWIRIAISKHTSNFSASFLLISEEQLRPLYVTVAVAAPTMNHSQVICQNLRTRVLDECISGSNSELPLSRYLIDEVIQFSGDRK